MRILIVLFALLVPITMLAKEQEAIIKVYGNCGSCKKRIVAAAKSVEGVTEANWDKRTKVLTIEFDDTKASVESVTKAILKVGHDVDEHKAEEKAYNALPECCAYRDREH